MSTLRFFIFISFLCLSCNKNIPPVPEFWRDHQSFELDYEVPSGLLLSQMFSSEAEARGISTMVEASGIVVSKANPGFIWSHEDRNNENHLFLLDRATGETVARYMLTGMTNRDWEDIEIGPGPEPGKTYIYLADTGDNNRVYWDYTIYRFEEPVFEEAHRNNIIPLTIPFDAITFTYPDKLKHDCETLLLDPWTKDLFVVTKRTLRSIIYVLPYPQSSDVTIEAIRVGEFPFTRAVGGNISADGTEMLLKTYDHILHWQRDQSENMVDMFRKEPVLAPYNPTEPQGEAICFDEELGYYTLSEFSNSIAPVLYHYTRIR